jgi:hypothetical protein
MADAELNELPKQTQTGNFSALVYRYLIAFLAPNELA